MTTAQGVTGYSYPYGDTPAFHYFIATGDHTSAHQAPREDFEAWLIEQERGTSLYEWHHNRNISEETRFADVAAFHSFLQNQPA